MFKLSQIRDVFKDQFLNYGGQPGTIDPARPPVQGGMSPQYGHATPSAIPRQYTQIPDRIPQTTANPLINTILGMVVPPVAGMAGVGVQPAVSLKHMDPIRAGEAITYTEPAYEHHMLGMQRRAARPVSEAIINAVDEGHMLRLDPNWNRGMARQRTERFLGGPLGAPILQQAPQGSPIRTMVDPQHQLFHLSPYFQQRLPKTAFHKKPKTKNIKTKGSNHKLAFTQKSVSNDIKTFFNIGE